MSASRRTTAGAPLLSRWAIACGRSELINPRASYIAARRCHSRSSIPIPVGSRTSNDSSPVSTARASASTTVRWTSSLCSRSVASSTRASGRWLRVITVTAVFTGASDYILFRERASSNPRPVGLEERAAAVFAEDVAHRVADLADRAACAERLLDRVEQVALAAGDIAQLLELRVHGGLVAVRLPLA